MNRATFSLIVWPEILPKIWPVSALVSHLAASYSIFNLRILNDGLVDKVIRWIMRGLSHTGIVHQAILWVVGNGRKSRHDAGSPMKMKRKLFSKSLYNLTSRWVHGGRKESSTVPRAFFESGDVASQPQIPLSERPATFVTSFALIKKWYGQAEGKLAEVGNSLAEDGGPLRKELHTELDWLVEDAIGQMKLCSQEDEDVWEPAKWDQIASELCGTDGDNKVGQVKLRISLLQLGTFIIMVTDSF